MTDDPEITDPRDPYRRPDIDPPLPSAETIIQVIALAGGKLKGHERYLTKYEMVRICRAWLKQKKQETPA